MITCAHEFIEKGPLRIHGGGETQISRVEKKKQKKSVRGNPSVEEGKSGGAAEKDKAVNQKCLIMLWSARRGGVLSVVHEVLDKTFQLIQKKK